MSDNPYQPPVASVTPAPAADSITPNNGPSGLGGWLILVMIGMILTPIRLGTFIATTLVPLYRNGTWEILTSPGSESYHPLWAPLLIFEFVVNLVFILACMALLGLFFTKSRRFPRMFIIFIAANLIFLVVDYVLGGQIPAVAAEGPVGAVEIVRTLIAALIWVPYMLVSKRVKNTFV